MEKVRVKKETKNKIRVDFERAPFWERFKQKYVSLNFLKRAVFVIFRLILLLGISYVILYPYITSIFGSIMSPSDIEDPTVVLITKNPSIDQYKAIITENGYFQALLNTFLVSFSVALIQTFVCAFIAYGLAKFKFKGSSIVFFLVIFTMMVPQDVIRFAMQTFFNNFGTKSPIGMLLKGVGAMGDGLSNSPIPLYILSFTGLGFRNGLFIFMLRQFFKGVPDELEESAFVDGSNTFRTFFSIIIPLAIPMMITVFIFSFAWQWTDNFYLGATGMFGEPFKLIDSIATSTPNSLLAATTADSTGLYKSAILGTASILIALPLIIGYVFLQKKIVQGIERSGIVG
ncbi:MAG: carbohydrate ABC transporter permease [Clostridia bacterium]|nr:carbohydrate ABC transporter permease [Clostridia bacterium]